jgi:hypothetical protein
MIIHDGKKIEVNIGGISKSQLEKILSEHGQMILDGLGKKIGEMPKQTVVYNKDGSVENQEAVSTESLNSIAKEMVKDRHNTESNFDSLGKRQKVKMDKEKVKKTLDLLNDL